LLAGRVYSTKDKNAGRIYTEKAVEKLDSGIICDEKPQQGRILGRKAS